MYQKTFKGTEEERDRKRCLPRLPTAHTMLIVLSTSQTAHQPKAKPHFVSENVASLATQQLIPSNLPPVGRAICLSTDTYLFPLTHGTVKETSHNNQLIK